MFSPTLVHEYLTHTAKKYPGKAALICGEERWTYQALDQASWQVAAALAGLGMKRQDRVAILMDSSPEAVISLYGVLKAGGIFVILDSSSKAQKLGHILRDSGAAVLITHANKADVVREAVSELPHQCRMIWSGNASGIPQDLASRSLSWRETMEQSGSARGASPASRRGPSCINLDLAALIYTSGPAGEPRGVMASHHNMVSAAGSIIHSLENSPDDIILNVLPLSFDYGLYQVITAFMFGGTVVLDKTFIYPINILECIKKERVTGFPLVPTIAVLLLRMKDVRDHDLRSLRYITNTAAALPVEHLYRFRSLFPRVRFYSLYGLTECKDVSCLPPEELDRKPSSVGKAVPNSEVFIVDRDGREVGPGEIGELVVRGANVMCGYWNSPELTAKVFRPGRLPGERQFHSGDLFSKDTEGFLYFVGRTDDMIATKGERVSPREVESVLREMKGIADAAVIGVPDEMLGQAVKAFIVPASGVLLTEREVLKHCGKRLEALKVPKQIEFVKELFRTSSGKIDKRGLQRKYAGA
jgi:amino acid adenylation domain-containing protein